MNFFVLADHAGSLIGNPEHFAAMCEEEGLFRLVVSARHDHFYWAGFAMPRLGGTTPRRLLEAHDAFLGICRELREELEADFLRQYREDHRLPAGAGLTEEQQADALEAGAEAHPYYGNSPYFFVYRHFGGEDVSLDYVSGGEVLSFRLAELMLSQALVTATALRHDFHRQRGPAPAGADRQWSDFLRSKMLMWRASLFGAEALHFAERLRDDGRAERGEAGSRPARIFSGNRRPAKAPISPRACRRGCAEAPDLSGWPGPPPGRHGLN